MTKNEDQMQFLLQVIPQLNTTKKRCIQEIRNENNNHSDKFYF